MVSVGVHLNVFLIVTNGVCVCVCGGEPWTGAQRGEAELAGSRASVEAEG